jgi:hypothetical protein
VRELVTRARANGTGFWASEDSALLPTGERGHLHDLYQVDERGISLRLLPEQLVFLE